MTQPDKVSLFVHPTKPFVPGQEPTEVEYEVTSLSGAVTTLRVALGEAIEVEIPAHVRHRYIWGDKAGAWNDEGSPDEASLHVR